MLLLGAAGGALPAMPRSPKGGGGELLTALSVAHASGAALEMERSRACAEASDPRVSNPLTHAPTRKRRGIDQPPFSRRFIWHHGYDSRRRRSEDGARARHV